MPPRQTSTIFQTFASHIPATSGVNFDIDLENMMAHGLRFSSIWTYLQNASKAASVILQTFASHIPTHFSVGLAF